MIQMVVAQRIDGIIPAGEQVPMIIGIVSDSHGNLRRLEAALAAMAERNVQAIVHCGDIVDGESIRQLATAGVPAYVVAGNMDRHAAELQAAAQQCGVKFGWEVIEVPLDDGRYLVAMHGHDEKILGEMIAEQQFPYVCHGHTHRFRDEHIGGVRVINPGALRHARGHHGPTVAVLDTQTDTLERIAIHS